MRTALAAAIGCGLLLSGCPKAPVHEGGIELHFTKVGGATRAHHGDAGWDDDANDTRPARQTARLGAERRLANLKVRGRIDETREELKLWLPGATDVTAKKVTAAMMSRGVVELCALEPRDHLVWCDVDVAGVTPNKLASGEGCSLQAASADLLQTLSDVKRASRVVLRPVTERDGQPVHQQEALSLTGCITLTLTNSESQTDPNTRRPTIALTTDATSRKALTDVTTAHQNHTVPMLIDGVVELSPVVSGVISGGRLMLSMGGGDRVALEARAEALAAALSAGPMPELQYDRTVTIAAP